MDDELEPPAHTSEQDDVYTRLAEYENLITTLHSENQSLTEQLNDVIEKSMSKIQQQDAQMVDLQRINEELNQQIDETAEKFHVACLADVARILDEREAEIQECHHQLDDKDQQIKELKANHEAKQKENKNEIALLKKKIQSLQKVEQQNSELVDKIENLERFRQQTQQDNQEYQKLNKFIEQLQTELTDYKEKFKKYKKQYLEEKSEKEKLQFEIRGVREQVNNLNKQLNDREQQNELLIQEINRLEEDVDKLKNESNREPSMTLQNQGIKSINSSQILQNTLDHDKNFGRRMTAQNILALGKRFSVFGPQDLSHLLLRQGSITEEQGMKSSQFKREASKFSERKRKITEKLSENEDSSESHSQSSSEEEADHEQCRKDIKYWKQRAEELQTQVGQQDEAMSLQKYQHDNLNLKISMFLQQQEQNQKELSEAQHHFKTYALDIEKKEKQIQKLTQENDQLNRALLENGQLVDELTKSMGQYNITNDTSVRRAPQKKKNDTERQTVKLLEKQLKITKQRLEEQIQEKDLQINLVTSALLELSNGVITYRHGNLEPLLKGEILDHDC